MDRCNKPDKKIVSITSLILYFSILSFGAVEIWSITIVEASVLTLFIGWLIAESISGDISQNRDLLSRHEKIIFIALFIFLAYIFIQSIPLPSLVIKYLSSKTYELYSFFSVEKDPTMYISLYAYKTRIEFIRLLTYALFFIFISYNLKDHIRLELLLKSLTFFGFILAIFAIIQKATWTGKIYWFRELPYGGTPFGPFVNRNHYAGLIGMMIPLSLGLAFTRSKKELGLLFGFFGVVMAVSLFLSLSRGGIISFFCSLTIFAIFLSWKKFKAKKIWALGVFVFIVLLYLLYLGIDPIIDRFYKTDLTSEDRFRMWAETLKAVKDFYITGSGFGTFINVFPLYSSEATTSICDHAHNDYLEFLLEAGIIGSILLILFVFLFFSFSFKGSYEGRNGIIKISMISSIVSIAVHSVFDFNLRITSNALMFSAILGMAFANARIRTNIYEEEHKKFSLGDCAKKKTRLSA